MMPGYQRAAIGYTFKCRKYEILIVPAVGIFEIRVLGAMYVLYTLLAR